MSAPIVRHLTELARHMAWADRAVWTAVFATPQAVGDARITDTLYHTHLVQHLFLQSWRHEPFKVRERGEFTDVDGLAAWSLEAHRGVMAFLESVADDDLDREFRVPWAAHFEERAKRPAGTHTLGESVLQVALHTQHHRGQVCTRLREVGGEPPTVDFIFWLWSGRPVAEWGAARRSG